MWNFTQNILPIHWKIQYWDNVEISRALRFKSLYLFWNAPQYSLRQTATSTASDGNLPVQPKAANNWQWAIRGTANVTSGHCFNSLRPGDKYSSVNWVITGPGNGLGPVRSQANICTNADLLSIWPWGINFIEIWIKYKKFSVKKTHLRTSAKFFPFCSGLNMLKDAC